MSNREFYKALGMTPEQAERADDVTPDLVPVTPEEAERIRALLAAADDQDE